MAKAQPKARGRGQGRGGSGIDGLDGYVGVNVQLILHTMRLLLRLLTAAHRPLLWMQIGLGRLVRILEFRRPIFGRLSYS